MSKQSKMFRKSLCIMLAFIMVIALLPVHAFAEDSEPIETEEARDVLEGEDVEDSGDPLDSDNLIQEDEADKVDEDEKDEQDEEDETEQPLEEEEESSFVEETQEETSSFTAGSLSYEGSDYSITVTYGAEARIPADAGLKVFEITEDFPEYSYYLASAAAAIEESSEMSFAARFFDISIVNSEEKEISPASDVAVEICYRTPEYVSEGDTADVVHFDDETGDPEIVPVDSSSDDMVQFNTDGFSVYGIIYTVEFSFEEYSWTIEGGESVWLSEILEKLSVTSDGPVSISDVEELLFSDNNLIGIWKTDDDWMLESLEPFDTQETLTLVLKNGNRLDIAVTDDNNRSGVPESTELVNFLKDAVIYGASINSVGEYVVQEGVEYTIALSFAEGSNYQFDNDAVLTYKMPSGIKILSEQTGPLVINVVYRNVTYRVDGFYKLTEDGDLSIWFDQNDTDYPILLAATNVSFRFTYDATFLDDDEPIEFSDTVIKDIIFDEPEPGKAYVEKTGSYNEETGTFTFTVTVTADGDVKNVNVKDTIVGNALTLNPGSIIIDPDDLEYVDHADVENGFNYTIKSMADGQTITITYTADVDFSQAGNNGKITADQTKNTVTVQPENGEPHHSEYSREITFKSTKKSDGTIEPDSVPIGGKEYKIIDWSITYNPLALASAANDTIKDEIDSVSAEYMTYYGSGITVYVYNHDGTLAEEPREIPFSDLTEYSSSSWKYTIPETDSTPYKYVIEYQTIVDMSKVESGGTAVTLNNQANGSWGGVTVVPRNEVQIEKKWESYNEQEVNWCITIHVPEGGLAEAVVTDTLPARYIEYLGVGKTYYDEYVDGSLEVSGLLPGETYEEDTSSIDKVKLTFHNGPQTGLQEHTGGHTITIRLTTKVNQTWLEYSYLPDSNVNFLNHINYVDINGKQTLATVVFAKPGIQKTVRLEETDGSLEYTIILTGVEDDSLTIEDIFDTNILRLDTGRPINIGGGVSIWSQSLKQTPVSYTETAEGIVFTANSIPKDDNGNYYPYYGIKYSVFIRDGVDLEALAAAEGGTYKVENTATWNGYEGTCTYEVKYEYLDKELLNEKDLGGEGRIAQYQIIYNPKQARVQDGETRKMTDVLSSNLSLDYSSVQITTVPAGVPIPYTVSGGPDGTTIATYIIPDETKVVITYSAMVTGKGSQTITNTVDINGKTDEAHASEEFGTADEGQGAVASFKIVKVDGYDASQKLEGVRFRIFAENPNLAFDDAGTTELILETNQNGEIIFDGTQYKFYYYPECYHVQEIEAPEGYMNLGFDYLVTLTNDMSQVDYGHYIYYFSDTMQIKNWPLQGLVVEKIVQGTTGKDKLFQFRMSILDEHNEVDTNYNEKNGDDQFVGGVTEFFLKDGQQKSFWGFTVGTRYKVEEINADGFVTSVTYGTTTETTKEHIGVLASDTEIIVFTNTVETPKATIQVTKDFNAWGKADSFTFTLTPENGAPMPGNATGAVTATATATNP
ncbi:MAG: hypothetical protein J5589_11110, partial [Firmicutes bacterium]|nr:hypothetical protein [Bacillota bacterium]